LAALAAECISAGIGGICKSQIALACKASKILLRYLLSKLNPTEGIADLSVTVKQLVQPIRSLCTASVTLSPADYLSLVAVLGTSPFPSQWKKVTSGTYRPINALKTSNYL